MKRLRGTFLTSVTSRKALFPKSGVNEKLGDGCFHRLVLECGSRIMTSFKSNPLEVHEAHRTRRELSPKYVTVRTSVPRQDLCWTTKAEERKCTWSNVKVVTKSVCMCVCKRERGMERAHAKEGVQERDHQAINLKEQPILSSDSTVGLRLSVLIQGTGNADACRQEMGCQERRNWEKRKKKSNDSHLFGVDSGRMFTLKIWSDYSVALEAFNRKLASDCLSLL